MSELETLLKSWEKDASIDGAEPSRELIRVPLLHSKYLNVLTRHRNASKNLGYEYHALKRLKWEYYTGKMSQDDLDAHGWEPFRYTLKSDVSIYIDGDSDLNLLLKEKAYHDEIVDVCKEIMAEIKARTYQLQNIIKWEQFIGGQ